MHLLVVSECDIYACIVVYNVGQVISLSAVKMPLSNGRMASLFLTHFIISCLLMYALNHKEVLKRSFTPIAVDENAFKPDTVANYSVGVPTWSTKKELKI